MYNNIRIFSINRFYDSNMLSWIVSQQAIEVIWLPPKRSFAHIHIDIYIVINWKYQINRIHTQNYAQPKQMLPFTYNSIPLHQPH